MNRTEQQFFVLLRSGLWNSAIDADLFSDAVDWKNILKIASMQTVSGVVYDGINKLPSETQPPTPLMRKLYQTVIRIEQSHEVLNQRLTEIVPLLQSEGINPILFKGQGVAQNYPTPIRRQCGDIDLYIGEKEYQKACALASKWGFVSDDETESHKHYHFNWNGVVIEFHIIAERLFHPIRNKRFQLWSDIQLHGDKLRVWNLSEADISLPPINFDCLYIFNHLYHHFLSGGIGLRQLCDWTLYLHTFYDQINKEDLLTNLESFGLLKPWQIFGCIVVNLFGLSKDKFPLYNDKYKNDSQIILNEILKTGNFGAFNPSKGNRPSGFLSGKLHSLIIQQKYLLGIFAILPKDVLTFNMIYWKNGIIQIFKTR